MVAVRVLGTVFDELAEVLRERNIEVTEDGHSADAVIHSFSGKPQELRAIVESPRLTWVQLPSAGIERFNDSLTVRPDLQWTSAKGAYARPVGEHALALTLALLRRLPTRVLARSWGESAGTSLHGLRVVVIGAGGIAVEILRLLRAFDTHVTMVRRLPQPVADADATIGLDRLDEVLPKADVVIVAAALTDETRGLLGEKKLELLPKHAIIVNIARGGLIDTEALTKALATGTIAGAGLDVTDPEPLPDGHPLWDEPRALITPHTADTFEMVTTLFAARVAENLDRFVAGGELEGVVDPAAGY